MSMSRSIIAAWALISYCNHVVVSATSSNLRIMCCMDVLPPYTLCALTSHHRVRCSSALKQLAKHHWHVTYTPCKAIKKPYRALLLFCVFVCSVVVDDRRERQKTWHVLTERAWVRGVGIDFLLQSCCC